ncbi:MAG: hypothetical protein M1834_008693 [Cirrosporium novae-zelandiae]|nr:MAG: hypothetical protein M1834_008693 [Cirrosporium novae-zelandiae]
MARLHIEEDEGVLPTKNVKRSTLKTNRVTIHDPTNYIAMTSNSLQTVGLITQPSRNSNPIHQQRPLKVAPINSLLLPLSKQLPKKKTRCGELGSETPKSTIARVTPRRTTVEEKKTSNKFSSDDDNDDDEFTDLSGFIVYSDSEEDIKHRKSPTKRQLKRGCRRTVQAEKVEQESRESEEEVVIDLVSPELPKHRSRTKTPEVLRENHRNKEKRSSFAISLPSHLRFSPPREPVPSPNKDRKHRYNDQGVRLVTPPSSPTKSKSKSKLDSPTRKYTSVPPSPHRPSLDDFWNQEVINEWNDQYSSQKTPKSTHSRRWREIFDDDENDLSPSEPPRRRNQSPSKSPIKAAEKSAAKARKEFDEQKQEIANAFLKELDEKVGAGKVSEMSTSTGGVRIIWNKKLNTTAGRANWKKEVRGSKSSASIHSSADPTPETRHYCTIELATKVITTTPQLLNVLAHEYCHLATFVISGIKNSPHGPAFKSWGNKCSSIFADREIVVTTKHSYEIEYKYIWECKDCGIEFKRHSKSIDPRRHTCGSCKGALIQTKPVPRERKECKSKGNSYLVFVKENMKKVRDENKGLTQKEIMGLVGKMYHEQKKGKEVINIEDIKDDDEEVVLVGETRKSDDSEERKGVDNILRKLDSLNLEA